LGGQHPWIEKSGENFWRRQRVIRNCTALDKYGSTHY
jgi:hypothetical protein